jgi:hypothetical protein
MDKFSIGEGACVGTVNSLGSKFRATYLLTVLGPTMLQQGTKILWYIAAFFTALFNLKLEH